MTTRRNKLLLVLCLILMPLEWQQHVRCDTPTSTDSGDVGLAAYRRWVAQMSAAESDEKFSQLLASGAKEFFHSQAFAFHKGECFPVGQADVCRDDDSWTIRDQGGSVVATVKYNFIGVVDLDHNRGISMIAIDDHDKYIVIARTNAVVLIDFDQRVVSWYAL